MYLLSQMDEPPEVSPLGDLPPQPLPPRLAALERQRANSAGGVDNTEPSPFATNSGGVPPFSSSGSVVSQQNAQPNTFNNAFASGSGSSSAGNLKVASAVDPKAQTQRAAQGQTSSSPQPGLSAGNYTMNGAMSASPTAMTSKSVEQQEEELAAADALAALTFAEAPESPQEPKAKSSLAPPQPTASSPVSASTSESESGRQQYQTRSSFAPNVKAVERKTHNEAQQAAIQEGMSKPGRRKGKAVAKGRAWGSSDDEDDEDEPDEDSGDEKPTSRVANQQLGSSSILSPQPQPHPTHPTHPTSMSELSHVAGNTSTVSSRRLPAIPTPAGPSRKSPAPHSRSPDRGQESYRLPGEYSRPSSSDPHGQQRRQMDHTDEFGRRGPAESGSRGTLDRQAQTLPNRPMWSTMLDPQGEMASKSNTRDTFVRIEPNETMTMAFTPQGLLQAGMQDKQSRSAKQREAHARETGGSLVNVPNPPPPPQMGLVGAITALQRDRDREGGFGAVLTEKERDRRLAEERERKYDELQRARLDKAISLSGNNMEMQAYNPMMLSPMVPWGMPMMYGMNGMGMGGMGMGGGWGGMSLQQQQQQQYQMWTAQQAAAQAYQQAMMSFSQAGSQAGSDAGDPQDTPLGRSGAVSPLPGWGPAPMATPMMTPMMPGMMPGVMPGMMPGMGMMPGVVPGYGMGGGSGFMQPSGMLSPGSRMAGNDDSRFSPARTPRESPGPSPSEMPHSASKDNHAS